MGKHDPESRPRGVLTDRDRTYLRLTEEEREEQFSPSARSKIKRDISKRVRNTLLDLPILAAALDKDLLERALGDPNNSISYRSGEVERIKEITSNTEYIEATVEFLLRTASADSRLTVNPMLGIKKALRPLLDGIENGIENWLNRNGVVGEVSLSIEIDDRQPIDEFADSLADSEEPPRRVVGEPQHKTREILSRGGFSTEEIDELIEAEPTSEE